LDLRSFFISFVDFLYGFFDLVDGYGFCSGFVVLAADVDGELGEL